MLNQITRTNYNDILPKILHMQFNDELARDFVNLIFKRALMVHD